MKKASLISLSLLLSSITAYADVANTVHNLSTSGPSETLKSGTEDRICIFCHTPHAAEPDTPLWNRRSGGVYIEYKSSTMDAEAGNMSSSSELCLSCHDGTIALGDMITPSAASDLGNTFITGRALVGTDLSDDHPVSIRYTFNLTGPDPDLVDPNTIDLPLWNNELHCASCHDAHDDTHPPFLHKSSLNGELCTTCHQQHGSNWSWSGSSHATSNAIPNGVSPWSERKPLWAGLTVSENACMNCHAPHNAATPERLVKDLEENTCYLCHDGTTAQTDILSEQQKFYHHPVEQTPSIGHDSMHIEDPFTMTLHVECEDCHNPHASYSSPPLISFNPADPFNNFNHSTAPFINGSLAGVNGIDINGSLKPEAEYEYEICFKCHGVLGPSACGNNLRCSTADSYDMVRQDGIYNIREKINSGNPLLVSYHPIESNNPSNNSQVPSLRSDIPLTTDSGLIYCSDCHNSNSSPAAGSTGPSGTHGSTHEGMLSLSYDFNPQNSTPLSNELCFKCHDSGNLYTDQSFPHSEHILNENIGCINCHDPHGSATNEHLINFLISSNVAGSLRQMTGAGVYTEPTWLDNGLHSGTCWLNCHGQLHDGWDY
ncbi:MAG: cytochrome c3 family protein [Candidatus Thiodiazotropha sp.]